MGSLPRIPSGYSSQRDQVTVPQLLTVGKFPNNARAETVARLASFRGPWQRRQFALVPAQRIFEPNYESGRSQWWAIERDDGEPFCMAGIWDLWTPHGEQLEQHQEPILSFAILTIDATDHPLMQRFHAPGKEKRSVVVIDKADHEGWLSARNDAEARTFLKPFDADQFIAGPDKAVAR